MLSYGQYRLKVYEGDCRGRLLHEFRTRERQALVAEIEHILIAVNQGQC